MNPHAIPLQQISQILDVTDALELNREWVNILLSPQNPRLVCRLSNGKFEITVDTGQPFDRWLTMLPTQIQQVQGS